VPILNICSKRSYLKAGCALNSFYLKSTCFCKTNKRGNEAMTRVLNIFATKPFYPVTYFFQVSVRKKVGK
jgi:hypothetical protein